MAGSLSSTTFPGETAEYRRARNRLLLAEIKLRRQIEAVAEQRRGLPLRGQVKTDYLFDASSSGDKDFKTVRLSALFAPGQPTLFIYNFMFPATGRSVTPCPCCTSLLD